VLIFSFPTIFQIFPHVSFQIGRRQQYRCVCQGLLKVAYTCSVSILTAGLGMAALNGDNKAVSPLAGDSSMLPSGQSTAMIAVIIGTYVPCDLSRSIYSMVPGGLPAYDYYFELASVQ
jgi:hypothetical protein